MTHPIDSLFLAGAFHVPADAPGMPDDERIAAWLDGGLSAGQREQLERQALACPATHALLAAAVDSVGARRAPARAPFRILARVAERGLQLLNEAELRFWSIIDGTLAPALGPLRRDAGSEPDLLTVLGPGDGLDELDLQLLAGGATRLVARTTAPPELRPGEVLSVQLETDGQVREKRRVDGRSQVFDALAPGRHVVSLLARAPGAPARPLARLELVLER